MYHYIIDQSRVSVKNFDRLLGEVYSHLTANQISGEVHRVTRLRNLPDLVEESLDSGARTVVAVGDDQTFLQIVELLASEKDVVLGYIPLAPSEISPILNVGSLEESCRAIAQRRVREFDLGKIGPNHFFTRLDFGWLPQLLPTNKRLGFLGSVNLSKKLASLDPMPVSLRIDNKYNLIAKTIAGSIVNAQNTESCSRSQYSANDGKLDLAMIDKLSQKEIFKYKKELFNGCLADIPGTTLIRAKKIELEGPKIMDLRMGGLVMGKTSANIVLSESKIKIIVGKSIK